MKFLIICFNVFFPEVLFSSHPSDISNFLSEHIFFVAPLMCGIGRN